MVSQSAWMRGRKRRGAESRWRQRAVCAVLSLLLVLGGCRSSERRNSVEIDGPWLDRATVAVAPALNQSGSTDFDSDRLADLMASEFAHARGVNVIPVSRVLGVLATQGAEQIRSAAHAMEVARLVGADALLVFSVTEYDPYDPPRIGIAAQLYGSWPGQRGQRVDPVALTRSTGSAPGGLPPRRRGLLSQHQRVYDASHDAVVQAIRRYARRRDADESPFGWRKYIVSQQDYFRFCAHETIRNLLQDGGVSAEERANSAESDGTG